MDIGQVSDDSTVSGILQHEGELSTCMSQGSAVGSCSAIA